MRGLRQARNMVDLDYPPFFIDRVEDVDVRSAGAADLRPVGNDTAVG